MLKPAIKFKILSFKDLNPKLVLDLTKLIKQVSSFKTSLKLEELNQLLDQNDVKIIIAENKNQLVAMITVNIVRQLVRKTIFINDLVVDKNFRQMGIGQKLIYKVIDFAKKEKIDQVDLTSSPNRIEANKLYQKLGFKKRQTNVYRLKLG